MTTLAHLSLTRVGFRKVPHVPTPDERFRAWQQTQPVQFANTQFSPAARPATSSEGRVASSSRSLK